MYPSDAKGESYDGNVPIVEISFSMSTQFRFACPNSLAFVADCQQWGLSTSETFDVASSLKCQREIEVFFVAKKQVML